MSFAYFAKMAGLGKKTTASLAQPPAEPKIKQATVATVKTDDGETIIKGIDIPALKRFSQWMRDNVPKNTSIKEGEELVVTIPTKGMAQPDIEALKHVFHWIAFHGNKPRDTALGRLSREKDNFGFNALVQLVATTDVIAIRPMKVGQEIRDETIQKMVAYLETDTLKEGALEMLVKYLPGHHPVTRSVIKTINDRYRNSESSEKENSIVSNAIDNNAIVKDLFDREETRAFYAMKRAAKAERAAAKAAKEEARASKKGGNTAKKTAKSSKKDATAAGTIKASA